MDPNDEYMVGVNTLNSILSNSPADKNLLPSIVPLKKKKQLSGKAVENKRIAMKKVKSAAMAKKQHKRIPIPREKKLAVMKPSQPQNETFNARELAPERSDDKYYNIYSLADRMKKIQQTTTRRIITPSSKKKGRVHYRVRM